MNDIRERLISCFNVIFPELLIEEILDLSQDNVDFWDSISSVTLVSVVEEEFGISIPPESLLNMNCFDSTLLEINKIISASDI